MEKTENCHYEKFLDINWCQKSKSEQWDSTHNYKTVYKSAFFNISTPEAVVYGLALWHSPLR